MMLGHTRSSGGRRRPSSPHPAIRAGTWRCAMPKAPRQLPPLPPPEWAHPTARTNSDLDKTWGQSHKHLQMEGYIWRNGCVGSQAAEDAGGREYAAEAAACRCHAGQCSAEGAPGKEV